MKCQNGHEIIQGDTFCIICGSTSGSRVENDVCASGHLVEADGFFCSRCGIRIGTHSAHRVQKTATTRPFDKALRFIKRRQLLVAGCVGGIAILVVVITLIFGGSSGQTLTVSFTENSLCSSLGPVTGNSFVVSDGNGKEIGNGFFENPTDKTNVSSGDVVAACEYSGTTSVPNDLSTYVIKPSHKNSVSFSRQNLIDNNWTAYIES